MLTEICQEIKNWFDRNQPKYHGRFEVKNNIVYFKGQELPIQNGQYFRIIGSVFNDGVHLRSSDLINESFSGSVWLMAVPCAVIDLSTEIKEWQNKYGGVDSENMSPYNSESFGGYSYSKSGGGSSDGSNTGTGTWQSTFAKRLNAWRKI